MEIEYIRLNSKNDIEVLSGDEALKKIIKDVNSSQTKYREDMLLVYSNMLNAFEKLLIGTGIILVIMFIVLIIYGF